MASQRVRVCVVEYNWYLFSRVGETGRESQRKYEREREREREEWRWILSFYWFRKFCNGLFSCYAFLQSGRSSTGGSGSGGDGHCWSSLWNLKVKPTDSYEHKENNFLATTLHLHSFGSIVWYWIRSWTTLTRQEQSMLDQLIRFSWSLYIWIEWPVEIKYS